MRLIALRAMSSRHKNVRGGRVLPGDEFEINSKDGDLLVKVKQARLAESDPGKLPPPPVHVASVIGPMKAVQHEEEELDRLRAEAGKLGIDVDGRWRVARLHEEIASAKAHPAPAYHDKDDAADRASQDNGMTENIASLE